MSLQKEILKIKEDSEKFGIERTKKILQLFKRNQDDVLGEISKIYMKHFTDEGLTISDYQRYSSLISLEKQLRSGLDVLSDEQTKQTYEILTDVFEETFYKTAFIINKGIQVNTNFALLRPEFIKAAVERPIKGVDFSSRIWNNKEKLAKRVITDVEKALIQEGRSPEKLARQIKKDYGSTAYEAKRLINTEVAKSVSYAQGEIYNSSSVIQKLMWDATLESNTCSICEKLDGEYFEKDNYPDLPNHPNCRCCYIPIVEGWKPTKKLENEVGADGKKKVIDYTDYKTWRKTKLGSA